MSTQLDVTLFNLKMTSKQLQRESKKAEKTQKEQEKKVLDAMARGNAEGARVYAQNAIRSKNESLNFLRLSSRIDGVASRVESAIRMKSVVKEMSTVTKAMDTVLSSMDPEKIAGMMDRFESLFDSMDVRTGYMDQAMASSTASSVPEDEVDNLIKMVQERNAIDMKDSLDGARVGSGAVMSPGAGVAAGPAKTAVAAGVLPPAPPTGPPGGPGTGPDGGAGGGSGGGGGGGGMDVADALAARLAGLRK